MGTHLLRHPSNRSWSFLLTNSFASLTLFVEQIKNKFFRRTLMQRVIVQKITNFDSTQAKSGLSSRPALAYSSAWKPRLGISILLSNGICTSPCFLNLHSIVVSHLPASQFSLWSLDTPSHWSNVFLRTWSVLVICSYARLFRTIARHKTARIASLPGIRVLAMAILGFWAVVFDPLSEDSLSDYYLTFKLCALPCFFISALD